MRRLLRSRWVDVPDGVREVPGAPLPAGFRAAGAAAGIKPSGGLDVGLLVSDSEETTSAARFTRSGTAAPPVLVTRDRARLDALKAIAVNSGNANAATGGRGMDEAARMQGAGAMMGRPPRIASRSARPASSACSSMATRSSAGCWRPARRWRPRASTTSSESIMTTDLFEKRGDDRDRPAGRDGPAGGAVQGRGHDPAVLRHHVVLHRDRCDRRRRDRRAAARRLRQALVRSHHGRRPAVDQRHRDPALRGRLRHRGRAGVRGRAALRPGARRAAAAAGASTCAATARAPGASAA